MPEGLAIDSVTVPGKIALWSNEAGFTNELKLWELRRRQPEDLAVQAAQLAKRVVGGNYELGAKGFNWWDELDADNMCVPATTATSVFVDTDTIITNGYYWNVNIEHKCKDFTVIDPNTNNPRTVKGFDNVLDCSGLVFWSYNKANGATKYQTPLGAPGGNPVHYEGADGQFRNNSRHVDEIDLTPGDLLFFDFQPGVPKIDHVAMYVGCCGPDGVSDVVEAFSPSMGIKWSRKDQLIAPSQSSFVDFGRITEPKEGIRFQSGSPIGLIVTDPDGFTITPETLIITQREVLREVPGELYYTQSGIDSIGNTDDLVIGPVLKTGVYLVQVVPKPNTVPTDTYSLKVEITDSIIILAQDVPISDIPSEGYGIKIAGSDITHITAIVVDIKPGEFPNAINPKSKGVIPVAILTTDTFDATTVNPLSIKFGPNKALEAHRRNHVEDVDKDGDLDLLLHFNTQETGVKCGNTHVAITGKTTDSQVVAGLDSILTVGCK